jgi:hypothetical protein
LSGHILDKDSEQPIPGARLTATLLDDALGSVVPERSVTSDVRGSFQLALLAKGAYQLNVRAPGYAHASLEVEVPGRASLSIELAGTSRLEGQVVDSAGTPVPGAEVQARSSNNTANDSEARADAQGAFSLEVNEGTYLLATLAQGQAGVHEGQVTVARGSLVDGLVLRLHPTGTLLGRAFAQSSQQPVKGAVVLLRHGDSGWSREVQSEADGSFRAESLVPGSYLVTLHKYGFAEARREDVRVQPGEEARVDFALSREAALEGTLTDSLGRPAEAVSLTAMFLNGLRSQGYELNRPPDASGRYELRGLPPGNYYLTAQLARSGTPVHRKLILQEGQTARADFVFPEALGEVEGTVLRASGGPPAHPAHIEFSCGDTGSAEVLDEEGRFRLKRFPCEYTFKAAYDDSEVSGPERTVRVEAGKVSRVTLTLPDTVVETSGVVLNARGAPVPEADVALEDGDTVSLLAETDGQGRFTLRTAAGTADTPASLRATKGPEQAPPQQVRLGSRDVVVRLQKASAMRGRLVVARGPGVQRFELRVSELSDSGYSDLLGSRPFVGDTFEWVDLPVGTLELSARTSDGRGGRVKLRLAPGQTANVELPVGPLEPAPPPQPP